MSQALAPGVGRPQAVANWLLTVAFMVFLIVVVGGITRLTESGLSMVRWEPIRGTLPPLNHAQWMAEFQSYQTSPQFQTVNRHISLAEFKGIYFWEYFHRLIGRTIGLVFALPLLWFWVKKQIPQGYGLRLTALLALGGLQGTIGWWMVASGLVKIPAVSHLRLATHLMTALFIMSGLIWTALDLRQLGRTGVNRPAGLRGLPLAVLLVLAVQLCWGAFVAGLDAGFIFAEWPLMGDRLFPDGVPYLSPLWHNVISQPVVVQFIHRWYAWVVAVMIAALALRLRKAGETGLAHGIVAIMLLQIGLGIATLLSGVAIPIAVSHQAVGAILLAVTVAAAHRLGRHPG
jgi:cytochrome c oxidase assembly protein subunit 15